MWRLLHLAVLLHWGLLTVLTIVEVMAEGELARTPYNSPNFSTASVLWFLTIGIATMVSALRAAHREDC